MCQTSRRDRLRKLTCVRSQGESGWSHQRAREIMVAAVNHGRRGPLCVVPAAFSAARARLGAQDGSIKAARHSLCSLATAASSVTSPKGRARSCKVLLLRATEHPEHVTRRAEAAGRARAEGVPKVWSRRRLKLAAPGMPGAAHFYDARQNARGDFSRASYRAHHRTRA